MKKKKYIKKQYKKVKKSGLRPSSFLMLKDKKTKKYHLGSQGYLVPDKYKIIGNLKKLYKKYFK